MNQFLLSPRLFYQANGGGGSSESQDDKNDASTGDDEKKDKGQAETKTFTQEQVNKMMAETRKQARASSIGDVLEKAGVKSTDELLTALAAYKKSEEDKLSDVEKAKKLAEDAKTEADKLKNELQAVRFERGFDKEILKQDLEFKNEKARDVAFKLLDVETASKGPKDMEEAVKALVADHSYLFSEPEADEIDATQKGKQSKNALKKDLIESKRRSGRYASI